MLVTNCVVLLLVKNTVPNIKPTMKMPYFEAKIETNSYQAVTKCITELLTILLGLSVDLGYVAVYISAWSAGTEQCSDTVA